MGNMKVIKVKSDFEVGRETARLIIEQINSKKNSILGLATGSSPIDAYKDLIQANKDKEVTFKDVTTFNLDEYIGLKPGDAHSYRTFMNENLFNHIDIDINKTHVPDPHNTTNPSVYDEQIAKAGGIDLQLLGLGRNGHVGFNEPGSPFDSLTRVVDLTQSTIDANSRFFKTEAEVPKQAVSMGLGSIMKAKKIVIIAMGDLKAEAISHLVDGPVDINWPCTVLRNHNDVTVIIDEAAGSMIK